MNKVYHLEVEVFSKRFGCLREKKSHIADLFFTHEEAYRKGKEIVDRKIRRFYEEAIDKRNRELYKTSDCREGTPYSLTVDDFVKSEKVFARWTITEIDLDRLKAMEDAGNQGKSGYHKQSPPIHIEYTYDHNGELLHRYYIWRFELQAFHSGGTYYQNRDGDDLPEAGTKFRVGDFVRLTRPHESMDGKFSTDTVFVVEATPLREKDGTLRENSYRIETVSKEGKYQWDSDFHLPFSGIHENELIKHEDEVDTGSPLWFLRRVLLGELGDVGEMVKKIENGEISLVPDVTWEELI